MFIDDGKGSGQSAGISNNRLDVSARVNTRAFYASRDRQECYTWSAAKNIDATDTILLVTNNSTTKRLFIESIAVGSDAATRYTVHSPAYPTLAGDAVTGVNNNRTSGNAADASAYQDETGNTQANILRQGHLAANTEVIVETDGRIILGYHGCIAVDIVAEPTMATCTIVGWYE
jgi:hypothetical protein